MASIGKFTRLTVHWPFVTLHVHCELMGCYKMVIGGANECQVGAHEVIIAMLANTLTVTFC